MPAVRGAFYASPPRGNEKKQNFLALLRPLLDDHTRLVDERKHMLYCFGMYGYPKLPVVRRAFWSGASLATTVQRGRSESLLTRRRIG